MRLDTISKIESFMTDSLLSSPQIPLGVNIVRLAGTSDEEGITALARSITVRYTGSSLSLEQTQPMSIYRRMSFEVTLAAQSYLTQTGHDYVTQMCAGSYNTLTNQVPANTGSQIIEAFHMTREDFQGISDSTHYVYTQIWELTVQEINPLIALDPCVARGNCSYLFPSNTISVVLPGDVLYKNILFSPIIPPSRGDDFDPDLCGVVEDPVNSANLLYKYNPNEVFLTDWAKYTLVSSDTFDESGRMLIVRIYDEDGTLFRTQYFSNCDNRRLVQVAGAMPNSANNLGGLWRSPVGALGNPQDSGVEALPPVLVARNGFGFVSTVRAAIFADPTDVTAATVQVKYGALFPTQVGVKLIHEDVTYLYVGSTPLGKAWIREDQLNVLNPNDYLPALECEGPEISDGVAQGYSPNDGPLP
tara:strand:+ start:8133 stop:9383 length:1251 start_codon:yes stop_codon:yes gene_type:complete